MTRPSPPRPAGDTTPTEELHHLRWQDMNYVCRVVHRDPDAGHWRGPHPVAEPLLLLGGALQDMYAWPRLERRIAPHTPVILVDLPGTGTADDLPEEEGFDTLAAAALHLLDDLGLARVNVLGASYGAPIAYRMAQRRPDRVSRLLLSGATHRVTGTMRAFLREAVSHIEGTVPGPGESLDDACPALGLYADRLVSYLVNTEEHQRVQQSAAVQRLLRKQALRTTWRQARRHAACHRRVLEPALLPQGGVTGVPALVFTGEHDMTTSPRQNQDVARTIAGSTMVLLKEADHMAHLERDAEYAHLVLRFLRDEPLDGLDFAYTA
ncbi:alpha/beta fold hydrolase [Kitasatospora aureofaciens]|uniref:alpha/beta fold hydrolase n=1 Tax=Kitasatospora aureofaciens TaxID=1894 RepID=UPI0005276390|nr:alpha/beta hydrolase [Kitasatospora aureofaciens]